MSSSFLVASGACISEAQYWCALEKSACPVGSTFVTVRELEMNYKDTEAIECLYKAGRSVPMGQCTLPEDKGLCTGDKSNCGGCFETAGKCFEPNNGACTLEAEENEDGSFNFAVFGLCVDPSKDDNEGHCLWSRNECPSSYVWVTPHIWLEDTNNIEDFCTCDKVLTGACRYGNDFECAVSEDACEDASQYIGAKALVDMEPSIICHLCDGLDLPDDAYPVTQDDQEEQIVEEENTVSNYQQPKDTSAYPENAISLPTQVLSYLAAAGACVTDDKYWCALEKSACPVGSTFVSAKKLETEYADTPVIQCLDQAASLPMGQCTLPVDKGVCTGNKSNCGGCYETAGKCFEPNNGACTLEATESQDGNLNFAVFGLCIDPKDESVGQCLWDRNECPPTDVWVTPHVWLENTPDVEDFCTCDKVLTGACRYGNDIVCAVSADACEDDSLYIGAKALFDMNSSLTCRLCDDLNLPNNASPVPQQQQEQQQQQLTSSSEERKTAAAGACVNNNEYWCALEKTQCPPGSQFVSARILLAEYQNTPVIGCLDEAVIVPMGRCTLPSDNGLCTGHKSNCQGCFETLGVCFEPDSGGACTLEATENQDGSLNFAAFGMCVNSNDPTRGHCLWSRNECPNTDTWVTPSRRLDNTRSSSPKVEDFCTCEKVLVGACRFDNDFVCAVSEDSCDDESEYIGAQQLKDIAPSVDCRLCAAFNAPENLPIVPPQIVTSSTPAPQIETSSTPAPQTETSSTSAPTSLPTVKITPAPLESMAPTLAPIILEPLEAPLESTLTRTAIPEQDISSKSSKGGRSGHIFVTLTTSALICIVAIMLVAWKVEQRRRLSSDDEVCYDDDQIIEPSI